MSGGSAENAVMSGNQLSMSDCDMKQSMIAEFAVILGTTVEYLVCGVIKEIALDESSAEMLRLFSSMDERTKEIMLIQMRTLVSAKGDAEPYGPAERLSRRIYYRNCSQLNGDLSKNPK